MLLLLLLRKKGSGTKKKKTKTFFVLVFFETPTLPPLLLALSAPLPLPFPATPFMHPLCTLFRKTQLDFNIKKLLNDSCQQRSKTKLKKRKKRLSLSLVFPLSSLQERGVKEFVEKSEASPRPCTCRRGSRLRVDCLGFILSKGRFGKGRRHVRCSLSLFTFSLFVARARDLVPCVPSSSLDARSLLLRLSSPAAALLVVGPCSSRSRAGSPRRPSCSS